MALFLLGLALFLASHLFIAFARGPRAAIISKIGEEPYKALIGVFSLGGLALIVMGWPQADRTVLYVAPDWMRHVVYLLMLIAIILLTAAYAPTGKIAAAVKHPMVTGVKVWAFAHLLINGDVRSVLLFGGILAFAVADRIAVKKRGEPTPAPGPIVNDLIVIAAGVVLYGLILFYLHAHIAGIALIAR